MEPWQSCRIRENLQGLIKNTICNEGLLARLIQSNIISDEDAQKLNIKNTTEQHRAFVLYQILPTRKNAFNVLLEALNETNQSGALELLNNGASDFLKTCGSIVYSDHDPIGEGVYGVIVYRGKFCGRKVAVKRVDCKIIKPEFTLEDVESMTKLDDHENIVRYFTYEKNESYIFIAMELCSGNLKQWVESLRVDIRMVHKKVLHQCASGIAYVHENNMTHRDLKPTNILVTVKGQIKISDVGSSKRLVSNTQYGISEDKSTWVWMAPEVIQFEGFKRKLTSASDIFSLGCVYYYVISNGRHPFGEVSCEQMARILTNKPELLTEKFALVPDNCLQLIASMIFPDPCQRPTADDVLESTYFSYNTTSNRNYGSFQDDFMARFNEKRLPPDQTMGYSNRSSFKHSYGESEGNLRKSASLCSMPQGSFGTPSRQNSVNTVYCEVQANQDDRQIYGYLQGDFSRELNDENRNASQDSINKLARLNSNIPQRYVPTEYEGDNQMCSTNLTYGSHINKHAHNPKFETKTLQRDKGRGQARPKDLRLQPILVDEQSGQQMIYSDTCHCADQKYLNLTSTWTRPSSRRLECNSFPDSSSPVDVQYFTNEHNAEQKFSQENFQAQQPTLVNASRQIRDCRKNSEISYSSNGSIRSLGNDKYNTYDNQDRQESVSLNAYPTKKKSFLKKLFSPFTKNKHKPPENCIMENATDVRASLPPVNWSTHPAYLHEIGLENPRVLEVQKHFDISNDYMVSAPLKDKYHNKQASFANVDSNKRQVKPKGNDQETISLDAYKSSSKTIFSGWPFFANENKQKPRQTSFMNNFTLRKKPDEITPPVETSRSKLWQPAKWLPK